MDNRNTPDSENPPVSPTPLPQGPPVPTAPPPTVVQPTEPQPTPKPTPAADPVPTPAAPAESGPVVYVARDDGVTATQAPQNNPAIASNQMVVGEKSRAKWYKSKFLVALLVLVILLGGSAYAYFGYFLSPSNIWSQSLSDMNIGYNRLVSYANAQSTAKYGGVEANGSFTVKSGSTNYDGSLSSESYGDNSTVSAKLNFGVNTIDLEERSIAVSGSSEPDVYLQISGIKSYLNEFLGANSPYDSLEGQWILIDHTLLNNLTENLTSGTSAQGKPTLTWQDMDSFLKSAGAVDKKYVFTSDPSYSVTKVIKDEGFQTINGHKTYHYKVGFVKANVKSYVQAMCSAFGQSSLDSYFKQKLGSSFSYQSYCTTLENSANKISSKDTIDVWADVDSRYIYQIRISNPSNPALAYVDIGLNYKSGDSYPFFISGQDKEKGSNITYSVLFTLNTNSNSYNVSINAVDDSSSPTKVSGNFTLSLNNKPIKVTAPANAEPLDTVLTNLGLGQYVTELNNLGTTGSSL